VISAIFAPVKGLGYLCQIRDVYTNVVLASCQEKRMKKELVLHTLYASQEHWNLPTGLIFHSNRGSQYTSQAVKDQISSYGWKQSYSRLGTLGDNAWSESFFSILKKKSFIGTFTPQEKLPVKPFLIYRGLSQPQPCSKAVRLSFTESSA